MTEGYELLKVPTGTVVESVKEDGTLVLKYPDGSTRYVAVGFRSDGGMMVTQAIFDKDGVVTIDVGDAKSIKPPPSR